MKIVIIEDEINAYEYLVDILNKIDPAMEVVHHCETVKGSVNYLIQKPEIDLILMDIQLADGISFNIFDYVEVKTPIIFITAFDDYAIEAFKVHSVDYLLKPVHITALTASIEKFKTHFDNSAKGFDIEKLVASIKQEGNKTKNRCLVKKGNHFEYVNTNQIAFVDSEDSITFLYTVDGHRHMYSKTVEQLFGGLRNETFFQISRSSIVNIKHIKEVHPYHNQRLLIKLNDGLEQDRKLVVSRAKASVFKDWLDQ